jgi:hypothetical protein
LLRTTTANRIWMQCGLEPPPPPPWTPGLSCIYLYTLPISGKSHLVPSPDRVVKRQPRALLLPPMSPSSEAEYPASCVHRFLSGTIIRGTLRLLNSAGKHHQHKATKAGTRSRLARARPRPGTVDPGGFTPRPRASSSNRRTLDSPEARFGQASQ